MSAEQNGAETAADAGPAPIRPARWRRRLAIAGAVGVGLVVAFRALLPYAIERAVPIGAERFGFVARLANVDFALLRGHVTLEGLRVAELVAPSEAPDLLSLGRLFVNLEWLRLLRGEVEVAELVLEQPSVSLVRAPDGYIELPALPQSSEPAAAEPEAEPSEPLPVLLKSLAIRDTRFRLLDAGGGADLVDFALKELAFSDLSLIGAKLGLGGIRISEPRLRVRRELRATKAGVRGQPATPGAAPAEGGAPPELRIDDLEIERAEFSVLTDGEPVRLALRLKTTGVSLAPDAPFPLDFGLEAGEGSVTLSGQLGLNPLVWDGKVGWQGLAVPLFVRAALPELIPWIRSCSASGDLAVKLDPQGVRVSGQLGVDDFAFEDPEQELALGWKSLAIELVDASVPLDGRAEPIQLALGRIALDAPQARYVLPNTAVERLLTSAGAAPGPEAAAPSAAPETAAPSAAPEAAAQGAARPRITIERIEVRGGGAEFVDRSGAEPYQGRVRDLSLDVAGVKLPERTVQSLRVRGIAPERAPFELRAALPGSKGTLSFKLERLPLAQFSQYAASAADLRIPKGELSLDAKASLANAGAAGKVDTKVVVHELSIQGGPQAISVAGMPLDLVLALLRDPKGDIALPIPLEYGEQGASAGIGTILLGALKAALTGAVTSPIKAVGALLPSGGATEISFEPIAFAPGSADAPEQASARLAPLAALLAQRPGLGLALIGQAGPEDGLSLAEALLVERVAADRGLPELEDAGFFARRRVQGALAERGRGEFGALEPEDQALLARYVEATAVPAERYAALARRRAEALRDRLVGEHALGPARIVLEAAQGPLAPGVATELRVAAAREETPSP